MPKSEISFDRYFAELPDPRVDRTKKHRLDDILAITLCAVSLGKVTPLAQEQSNRMHNATAGHRPPGDEQLGANLGSGDTGQLCATGQFVPQVR